MPPSFIQMRLRKARFFDRDIFRGVEEGHKRALARFGAFVRSDARKSMRNARVRKTARNTITTRRKGKQVRVSRKPSAPGTPPRAVQGDIKRFLFFEYENKNVVIGPWKLPHKTKTRHPVPAMHEQRHPSHAIVRRRFKRRTVTQRYPQRPFMVPAFEKNKKKLPGLYKDTVKRR